MVVISEECRKFANSIRNGTENRRKPPERLGDSTGRPIVSNAKCLVPLPRRVDPSARRGVEERTPVDVCVLLVAVLARLSTTDDGGLSEGEAG